MEVEFIPRDNNSADVLSKENDNSTLKKLFDSEINTTKAEIWCWPFFINLDSKDLDWECNLPEEAGVAKRPLNGFGCLNVAHNVAILHFNLDYKSILKPRTSLSIALSKKSTAYPTSTLDSVLSLISKTETGRVLKIKGPGTTFAHSNLWAAIFTLVIIKDVWDCIFFFRIMCHMSRWVLLLHSERNKIITL